MTEEVPTEWIEANSVAKHSQFPIKQVYVWRITLDRKVLVVSKDGKKWQLPGGKPELKDTSYLSTAIREVKEETSYDISPYSEEVKIFGYYIVKENNMEGIKEYIQLRTYLLIESLAKDIQLKPEEDLSQERSDIVKFADFKSLRDLKVLISWMEDSEEYKSITRTEIVKNDISK